MGTARRTTLEAVAGDRSCAEPARQQVKSVERVRDLGEVFTPLATVHAMLDQLPPTVWDVHPASTFLEPAAGDGNFLVAVLGRKLEAVSAARQAGSLPAGNDDAACEFHGLQALASVYGVDISAENIIGGVPGHEIGARQRLIELFRSWFEHETGKRLDSRSVRLASAGWVVEHNVMVGNMLPSNADGTPSGREQLPLVEYRWSPGAGEVAICATTLGAVESEARRNGAGALRLFDEFEEAVEVWSGPARSLRDAPIPAPLAFAGPARNGKTRK